MISAVLLELKVENRGFIFYVCALKCVCGV
jgi:hypothetical protein